MNGLGKKLAQFSIGPIVGAILSFVLIPLITHFISTDEYGKSGMFSLAVSIIQIVLYMGLDQAFVKRYYEVENRDKLRTNAMIPPFFIMLSLELAILLLRGHVALWLFGDKAEQGCVYALMLLLPALLVEQFALIGVRMEQNGGKYSALTLLLKILIFIMTVLLLAVHERSYRSVVWGTALAQIVYACLLVFIERKVFRFSLSLADRKEMADLLRFGLPLVPAALIGWVLNGMDKTMLRVMTDYSTIGLYETAAKVAAVLAVLQACFTTFWVPVAHQWNNEGVKPERFEKVGSIACAVMSIGMMAVLLLKEPVFLLFPESYSGALRIIPFLLLHPIMYTISEVTVMGIYFREKTMNTLVISAVSALCNLILNWLLIARFGAVGAAVATGVSYTIFFWARTLISRNLWFKFHLRNYILVTCVLLIACTVNVIWEGIPVLAVNLTLTLILLIAFRKEVGEILGYLLSILNRKKTA